MQRLRNLKKNPLEIEHTFLNSKNYVEFGRFFCVWMARKSLSWYFSNKWNNMFLKKSIDFIGFVAVFYSLKSPKKIAKIAPFWYNFYCHTKTI